MRVRLLVHALDRTGPPMLARALLRWIAENRQDLRLDVVAFRGGALHDDFAELAPTTVVLEDSEPWDHCSPDPARVEELSADLARLGDVEVTLSVSVAGGQCLPLLAEPARLVTWVVEQGEDLHWLDPPVSVATRTDRWLAGSRSTAAELRTRLGPDVPIDVAVEFVEPAAPLPEEAERLRRELLDAPEHLLVIGAGIGTWRKAPDLFLDAGLAFSRVSEIPARFVWVGGEDDPLLPLVRQSANDLGVADRFRWVDNNDELERYLLAADVMLHPARLDAFPLVCLHAASVGTPVVSFAGVGGVTEMFEDTFEGVGYPDVEGLARRIDELHRSGALQKVGDAQRRHVSERYLSTVGAPGLIERVCAP